MKQVEILSVSPPLSHHKHYSSLFKYKEQNYLNDSLSQICIFKLFLLQSFSTVEQTHPKNKCNSSLLS